MTADRLPTPPKGLSATSRRLWRDVVEEFRLSPAELELLRQALVARDRADAAAEVVEREGVVVVDRYGSPKSHPAADVEARNRALYGRFIAQLGIKADASARPLGRARPGPKPRLAAVRPVRGA